MFDCPNCDEPVPETEDCWNALGETFICPGCGCRFTVDGDYTGDYEWNFWTVEDEDWVQEQKERDKGSKP